MFASSGSEHVVIDGRAGSLEGLWLPAGDGPTDRGVVLCHPHPQFGGSMETKLVARTARRLNDARFQTLRFNFRGVGRSDGGWDEGRGERDDVISALDYAGRRLPDARLALFGFSFGAALGLDVGSVDCRVRALVAVAPPVRRLPEDWSLPPGLPTLVVAAGRDEVLDPDALELWGRAQHGAVRLETVASADHLFTGRTDVVADLVTAFLEEHL